MGLFKRKSRPTSKSNPCPSSSTRSSSNTSANTTLSPPASTHTLTQHDNHSSSNLSTTSTLLESAAPEPEPEPQRPVLGQRQSTYEAFLRHARLDEERTEALRIQKEAWASAEKRRRAQAQHWPDDPWRGGFGPPSTPGWNGSNGGLGGLGRDVGRLGVGGGGGREVRREVGDWLRGNGLSRR